MTSQEQDLGKYIEMIFRSTLHCKTTPPSLDKIQTFYKCILTWTPFVTGVNKVLPRWFICFGLDLLFQTIGPTMLIPYGGYLGCPFIQLHQHLSLVLMWSDQELKLTLWPSGPYWLDDWYYFVEGHHLLRHMRLRLEMFFTLVNYKRSKPQCSRSTGRFL